MTHWTVPLSLSIRSASSPTGESKHARTMDRHDLSIIPQEYQVLQEVFSKTRAMSMPPHRVTYPVSRFYSLSRPERKTMETYIRESLEAGHIQASSSPGCLFVAEKDKSLSPRIVYRGLILITGIKYILCR
ncbi:hypothetical protein DPEC_G00073250 [Dallia pectoralis]|uniref:Uncharacterized protein n=1 Tax=Dallia pectoralis TaxID=75939 RepID=A0ACC2H2R4_DALPE|nr:hypothetical protein DPEC_G00073250 [Dallia pectoralis]